MTDLSMERPLHDDVLYGAGAIAAFLFGDSKYRRRVYHLADKRQLPVFRQGDIICARKSTILTHIAEQERQAVAKSEAA